MWPVPAVDVDPQGAPGLRAVGGHSGKCPPGQIIACVSVSSAENGKNLEMFIFNKCNKYQEFNSVNLMSWFFFNVFQAENC